MAGQASVGGVQRIRLRRELRIWEVLALSIGLASPTLAMSFSGPGAAALVGRAVPLAFLFGGIVLCFIASGMVIVSRNFSHAGSVYGLTGATVGPRAGFFSGWSLLGCYLIFTPGSMASAGYFIALFLQSTGIWKGADYIVFALLLAALCWLLNLIHIRNLTRSLLSIEGISVTLLLVLMIVIVVRLAAGHAPNPEASLSLNVFVPQEGGFHGIALAAVFAFLAFAGFEGAMSLGEETHQPKRTIPQALIVATLGIAVFYLLCQVCQALGFGPTAKGGAAFAASSGPVFDLSHAYVGTVMAWALELGAAVSAFGSGLASSAGCARLIYAMFRDAQPGSSMATVTRRAGAPGRALAITMIFAIVAVVAMRLANQTGFQIWQYYGTIGTLLILVAYALVNVGAVRLLIVHRDRENLLAVAGPGLAVLFVLYILYNQIYPVPTPPYNLFPYICAAWLLIGLLLVLGVPGLARRIGAGLAREEGLSEDAEAAAGG